jgi:hypothetical protein
MANMASTNAGQLPQDIRELLERFVRRRRRLALARALGLALALAALWLLAWGLVDRLVGLHWIVRIVLLGMLGAALATVLLRPVRALLRRIDFNGAARQIEQRDGRFREALATVVSQRLARGPALASPQLVDHLVNQVQSDLPNPRHAARRLVPIRPAATALAAALTSLLVVFDLCLWPWLGLPQLLARQLMPLAGVPRVTTTRLEMITGSTQVVQGRPLTIIARANPPEPAAPVLRVTVDGRTFSSIPMTAAPDGTLVYTLAAVTRDTAYQVVAGDAVSPVYQVQVLRRPVVRDLRITLSYPEYLGREPLSLASAGDIEAPLGTRATVSIVASEPLADAWIWLNDIRLDSRATADAHVRQADIDVSIDGSYAIELISERGVRGESSTDRRVRGIPDRPPIARTLLPEALSLLRPGDSLIVDYQCADDYGLGSVAALVQVNQATPARLPLAIGDDPRRCEGSFRLDLAGMNVAVGDVVQASVAASDRLGQSGVAPQHRLLVCPYALSPEQRRCAAALRQAAHAARAVVSELSVADPGDRRKAIAATSSAFDSAQALVAALLRAGVGARAGDRADLVARLVDEAQVQASRLEQLSSDAGIMDIATVRSQIADAHTLARGISSRVTTMWEGQAGAAALAAELSRRQLPADRAPELIGVVASFATDLLIDPAAPDLPEQLRARVQAAEQLASQSPPVDFAQAAQQWAGADRPAEQLLAERLSAAARAQEARADASAVRTRDLQLASRAARSIDVRVATGTGPGPEVRQEYASALQILLDKDAAQAGIERARQAMRGWAGETEPPRGQSPVEPPRHAVAPRAEPAARTQPAGSDSPQQALAAIRRAQEALARMPELLDRSEQSADWLRETKQRVREAEMALQAAGPEQQPASRRALAAAAAQAAEAAKALSDIGHSLDPEYTWTMARELEALAPQAQAAIAPLEQELGPALDELHDAIEAADPHRAQASAGDVRYALALAQDGLRDARQAMLERDPLVAARWFAQQAPGTSSPSAPPPGARGPEPAAVDLDLPGYEQSLRLYFQLLEASESE